MRRIARKRGKHGTPDEGACLLETLAYLQDERRDMSWGAAVIARLVSFWRKQQDRLLTTKEGVELAA